MTRQSLVLVLSLAAVAPRLEAQRIAASAFDAAARPDVTALAAGFVVNEAWSILVAISDAVLGLSAPAAGPPGIGVRLVRVTF